MTFEEAIETAGAQGWTLCHLAENYAGGRWTARLWNNAQHAKVHGKPGYNDSMTEFGSGFSAADAILNALSLRVDRATGKVYTVSRDVIDEERMASLPRTLHEFLSDALDDAVRARR